MIQHSELDELLEFREELFRSLMKTSIKITLPNYFENDEGIILTIAPGISFTGKTLSATTRKAKAWFRNWSNNE